MSWTYSVATPGHLYGVQELSMVSGAGWGMRVADGAVALVLASGVPGKEGSSFCLTRSFRGTDVIGWIATENLVLLDGFRYF